MPPCQSCGGAGPTKSIGGAYYCFACFMAMLPENGPAARVWPGFGPDGFKYNVFGITPRPSTHTGQTNLRISVVQKFVTQHKGSWCNFCAFHCSPLAPEYNLQCGDCIYSSYGVKKENHFVFDCALCFHKRACGDGGAPLSPALLTHHDCHHCRFYALKPEFEKE